MSHRILDNALQPSTPVPAPCDAGSRAYNSLGCYGENLSVMIPNYNGAKTVGETIQSVWAQGKWTEQAEICVMDNQSSDDSEAVVKQAGKGRVKFVRHDENIGATRNFNACLNTATRTWVHVLHGDDCVLPGGYAEADRTLRENPDCNALFGRVVYMDEQSRWTSASALLGDGVRGPLVYDPVMWRECHIQFAGAFLRKDCIQATGGFRLDVDIISDWNLWWRVAKHQKPAYTNVCLGAYRISSNNGTSRVLKSGLMASDTLRHLHEFSQSEQQSSDDFGPMFDFLLNECAKLLGDKEAFHTNLRLLKQFPLTPKRRAKLVRMEMRFARTRLKK